MTNPSLPRIIPTGWRRLWDRLATRIYGLEGWQRWGMAFALGCLSSLSLPPFYVIPAALIGFSGLFWLLESAKNQKGFMIGWCFGFGHFLCSLYWIAHAFLVDSDRFAWLIPFAIGGLCAGMALYPAGACWMACRWSQEQSRCGLWLALIAAWGVTEWLRSFLLTGFPWNPTGHILAWSDSLLQLACVTGVWGLSLLALAALSSPALLAAAPDGRPGHPRLFIATCLLVIVSAIGGTWRLMTPDSPETTTLETQKTPDQNGLHVRIIQANIPQTEKWPAKWRQRNIERHIGLSLASGKEGESPPDVTIWPETAFPYAMSQSGIKTPLLNTARPAQGWLLLGGVRRSESKQTGDQYWNSLFAVNHQGILDVIYDKTHLVPFGEYIPFEEWIAIQKLTRGAGSFAAGPGLKTVTLPGLPAFSPLICYEVIFPGRVLDPQDKPQWLLNVTNDAWFGISPGPYQHLTSARLRAVEEGLPLARAANTGISALIDSYGRIIAHIPLGQQGVLDGFLPFHQGTTFYHRFGNTIFWSCIILFFIVARGIRPQNHE